VARSPLDDLPDVRDGLTRLERAILVELARTQAELNGRNVPTAMLYGRVVEQVDVSVAEFQRALNRLVGAPHHHQLGTTKPRCGRAKK
jgi:hypothetical protein